MKKLRDTLTKYTCFVDTEYRIGMRVIKTAVAVMICLAISFAVGSDNLLQISAVSALVTIRTTQQDTLHIGAFRVLGTVIGGLIGVLTVLIGLFMPFYSDGLFIIVIPLMLVLNLFICNFFKMQDSCVISCVVTIIVASQVHFEVTAAEAMYFSLFRVRDTFIGVSAATLINAIPVSHKSREHDAEDTGKIQ